MIFIVTLKIYLESLVSKMPNSRVTASVQDDDTFKVMSVQGTGANIADARGELQKKLLLMANLTVLSVSEATGVDIAGYPVHAASGDGDASLTLRKGTDRSTTRTINVTNLSTEYADATAQDGSIDVSNSDIEAFGTAYRDADGVGGYTVIRGFFRD